MTETTAVCLICLDEKRCRDICGRGGSHWTCKECVTAHVRNKVLNEGEWEIKCICTECDGKLDLPSLIDNDINDDVLRRCRILKDLAGMGGRGRVCPACENVAMKGNPLEPDMICTGCQHSFCYFHGDGHPTIKCADSTFARESYFSAISSYCIELMLTKKCPSCGVRIEKNQGCKHMHCMHCKAHFCWGCRSTGTCRCVQISQATADAVVTVVASPFLLIGCVGRAVYDAAAKVPVAIQRYRQGKDDIWGDDPLGDHWEDVDPASLSSLSGFGSYKGKVGRMKH